MWRSVYPLVFSAQVASSFFDTTFQMIVKTRCANATDPDREQREITNFNMVFNLILKFIPIVPAMLLAKIGDKGYRKVPIVVSLFGYVTSRALFLLIVLLEWQIEGFYAVPVIQGLCGGFESYWVGVMALVSVSTGEEARSMRIITTEMIYGVAGFIGSLASGHLFDLYTVNAKHGIILSSLCMVLYFFCFVYALLLRIQPAREESQQPISGEVANAPVRDYLNVALLFVSGMLYDVAVTGGVEMLAAYVLKPPLNWKANQVGYGNAAGYLLFISSFVGVKMFTRCSVRDESMIMIGIVSFAAGIYCMAFVTTTPMYFLARCVGLFALIPIPTIRSLLSKQVKGTSYGVTFIMLQLSFKLASLISTPIYTQIYQATLDTSPGFVFTLSSIFSVLSMIPISIAGCRSRRRRDYESIQGI